MNLNKAILLGEKRHPDYLVKKAQKKLNSKGKEVFVYYETAYQSLPIPNWKCAPPWAEWFCISQKGEYVYTDKEPRYGANGDWVHQGSKFISGWGNGENVSQWRKILFKRPQKYPGK